MDEVSARRIKDGEREEWGGVIREDGEREREKDHLDSGDKIICLLCLH